MGAGIAKVWTLQQTECLSWRCQFQGRLHFHHWKRVKKSVPGKWDAPLLFPSFQCSSALRPYSSGAGIPMSSAWIARGSTSIGKLMVNALFFLVIMQCHVFTDDCVFLCVCMVCACVFTMGRIQNSLGVCSSLALPFVFESVPLISLQLCY